MVKWIIAAILLLPLAEIAAFICVATVIGFGWALALMLLTTLAGILVLRRAGRGQLAHFRVAMTDSGIEADGAGLATVLAGVLLFLPGFLTDLIGAALLIGPIRRGLANVFRSWLGRKQHDDSVIDLEPDQWRKVPDRELPDRSDRPG